MSAPNIIFELTTNHKKTIMTTLDTNRLIAEYMGYSLKKCNNGKSWDFGKSLPESQHPYPSLQGCLHTQGKELKFNSFWDWLMPVVEKIEDENEVDEVVIKYDSAFENNYSAIIRPSYYNSFDTIHTLSSEDKISAAYQAVVEFINWHNQQNN